MRADDIALMLPGIWQRTIAEGSVTRAALEVMSRLHGSLEAAIADPSALADPRRAPDRLVPVLAMWLGLGRYLREPGDAAPLAEGIDAPWPGDLRELTAIAAALGRNRGNAGSLLLFLQAATGIAGFTITEDAQQPFHFHLGIPQAAAGRLGLILRVVEAEKPAFTTFDTCLVAAGPEISPRPDLDPKPDLKPESAVTPQPAGDPDAQLSDQ